MQFRCMYVPPYLMHMHNVVRPYSDSSVAFGPIRIRAFPFGPFAEGNVQGEPIELGGPYLCFGGLGITYNQARTHSLTVLSRTFILLGDRTSAHTQNVQPAIFVGCLSDALSGREGKMAGKEI